MNRRGHKSKKASIRVFRLTDSPNDACQVPNVRLRPADPEALRALRPAPSPEPSGLFIEDSQIIGSDDTVMLPGTCPRPFKNVVLCATGVADKTAIFKLAIELGASPYSAFTDRVTHLIAENHGGAKYQCALERKIPILKPSWITESHRVWQHGDDVDLDESISQHRLPIFSGVVLCISGLPLHKRAKISKTLEAHGGQYAPVLERPVKVTHLLCAGDEQTDKMHYADKFNRAKEANPPIQLVWEEWFWDCIEFGGRFDEARYDVRQPRVQRPTTDPSPTHPDDAAPSTDVPSVFDPDADEIVAAPRKPAITLQLWESLLKTRGYELNQGGNVMLSPKKAKEIRQSGAKQQEHVQQEKAPSVISSFRRANSIAVPAAGPSRLPFARAATIADAGPSLRQVEEDVPMKHVDESSSSLVFLGVAFLLNGETDTANVREAIVMAGGRVVNDAHQADYIIVRLSGGSNLYQRETSELRPRYRTECWLEQCLALERICAPDDHFTFLPLSIALPVPNASKIVLSFSGLETAEACWVKRVLKALGVTLATAFSRQSTHLLCPGGAGAKYVHARKWGTPVVGMEWLAAMARTGAVPDVGLFLVGAAEETPAAFAPEMPKSRNAKGKQKAEMQDITNNSQEDAPPPPPADKAFFLPSLPPLRPSAESESNSNFEIKFGRASGILGAPPPSPSPPKRQQTIGPTTPPHPPQLSRSEAAVRTPTPSPAGLKRTATVLHVADAATMSPVSRDRVPSSNSPSPLKRGVSITPPKISEHRKRALEESISSLLGKHARPETPEDLNLVEGLPAGRAGKPAAAAADLPVVLGGVRSQSPGATPTEEGYEGLSLSVGVDEQQEQSMRVMWADPGQREEKERLANLVGLDGPELELGGTGGAHAGRRGPTRAATRKQPRRSGTKKP
ncbi:hypothetical protein HMN09_00490100 [Mycena chlorophos]|uniref:BRCT domain-containing protein n=1 Tax=Mycena chlorophos TaxID=658473 RepID=A0A8H6TCK3_MYCCL|nr:hypothetical protein HMN09_00490100 [Mycena chlorophos]